MHHQHEKCECVPAFFIGGGGGWGWGWLMQGAAVVLTTTSQYTALQSIELQVFSYRSGQGYFPRRGRPAS